MGQPPNKGQHQHPVLVQIQVIHFDHDHDHDDDDDDDDDDDGGGCIVGEAHHTNIFHCCAIATLVTFSGP